MLNDSKQNKKHNYLNLKSLLLSTVCACVLCGNARAEVEVRSNGFYEYMRYGTVNPHGAGYASILAEVNYENTFTAQQTFSELTFSTEGSAIANTIAKSISSSSTDNELITAKGVYDYLDNAGIADMTIYAKTADVADTYATKTALSEGLGGKVDTSAFNEYKTTVGNTYATKDAISDMLTKTEAGNTYATKDALNGYATTASLDNYATKSSVYTTTQADDKFATKSSLNSYVTTESLGTTLSGYATTSSVYTTTQADDKFATKSSLNSYVTTESLGTTLGNYVTSASLNTTLGGYVTSGDFSDLSNTVSSLQSAILNKADSSNVYTKSEADNKFALKGSSSVVSVTAIDVPTRDAMKSWQEESNHGKYELSTTSSGSDNEKSIKISGTTYYFTPNEVNNEMNQTLNQLLASEVGVTTSGATTSDYVFTDGTNYYKFNTSSISASKIKIEEGTSSDYTYYKTLEDGTVKYYKVTGTKSSDARNANLSTDVSGGYYEGKTAPISSNGGALFVKTGSSLNKIEADFVGNQATHGGAIQINDPSTSVSNIVGDFNNNTATYNGGAINSGGQIKSVIGNFNNNSANQWGGAIHIGNAGSIDEIVGNFNSNKAEEGGGAIYNQDGTMGTITGDFKNNEAAGDGGSIDNHGQISKITGNFSNNIAEASGGAVYNAFSGALIGIINGNFSNNTANVEGGAISNVSNGKITSIFGSFTSNMSNRGGAILNNSTITEINADFINNEVTNIGGAIYNQSSGEIDAITGNFTGNNAQSGGAVYNLGTIGLLAKGQNVTFYNNTDSTGYNDLYGGIFNLNAQSGYNINFGGSISAVDTLNVNNSDETANRGGDYIFNNSVDAAVNMYNGAKVKLASIVQTDGSTSYGVINTTKTMTVDNVAGSNIDMRNDHIDINTVGGLSLGSNLCLGIDTNLSSYSTSTSDKLVSTAAATGDGKMVINAINLTHSAYAEGDSMNVNIADDNTKGKITIADDILDNITGATNYYTKVEYDEDTGDLVFSDKLVNKSTLDTTLNGYATTGSVYTTTQADEKFALIGASYTKDEADGKYATKTALNSYVTTESLGSTLGSYVTSTSLNTTLNNYVTSTSLNTTLSGYATTGSVYTKDQANEAFAAKDASYTKTESDAKYLTTHQDISGKANVGDSYTKTESDAKYLTTHQDISGKANVGDSYTKAESDAKYLTSADMSGYATTGSVYTKIEANNTFAAKGDVYTKTEANNTFAAKGASYTKDESDGKYALKGASYTKTEADEKFLTSADMSGYATTDSVYTKTEANNTFATKGDVYTKTEINTKLEGYATASSVSTLSGTVTGLGTTVSGLSTTVSNLQTAVDGKADKATVTELQGTVSGLSTTVSGLNTTVSGLSTTVSGLNTTVSNLQTAVDGKADKATVTELQGTVNGLNTTVSGLSSTVTELGTTVTGLGTTVTSLQTTIDSKADKTTVTALQGTVTSLQTAVDGKVSQTDFNDYKTSNNNAVAAAVSRIEQAENNIAGKQDALTTEQMAVLNSGVTADDVQLVRDASTQLNNMSQAITDLSNDFGDVADFTGSTTKNISNGSATNATTVTKAIANMDATMGQIHGLAAKVGVANGGNNLGQNTTVEEHLTALAGAIGDRTNYTMQNYIVNNQSVAKSLDALDIAVGNLRDDFATVQAENNARFQNIDRRIKKLDDKISKGIAGSNALAALKPLDSSYRSQLAVALGGFDGDQAVAFGGFHYINNKTMINAGISYSGRNYNSYNIGIVFGF